MAKMPSDIHIRLTEDSKEAIKLLADAAKEARDASDALARSVSALKDRLDLFIRFAAGFESVAEQRGSEEP